VLLDLLSRAENGLGLTELSRETELAKTTVHRLAEQLVDIGAFQRMRSIPADPFRGQGMSLNCVWHLKYTAVSCSRNPWTLWTSGKPP
jgi:hypothetical protein